MTRPSIDYRGIRWIVALAVGIAVATTGLFVLAFWIGGS